MNEKKKTFESALDRLEEITQELENVDTNLEQSMQLFQEANELSKYCMTKLNEAQEKLNILVKEQNTFKLTDEDHVQT